MTKPAPDNALASAILARASDIAHYMLTRGQTIAVAEGLTANGHPCAVIVAIGDDAELAREVGARLVAMVAKQREDDAERLRRN